MTSVSKISDLELQIDLRKNRSNYTAIPNEEDANSIPSLNSVSSIQTSLPFACRRKADRRQSLPDFDRRRSLPNFDRRQSLSNLYSNEDAQTAAELADLVRKLNEEGHNPATSGNYSLRSVTRSDYCLISESGVDKSAFSKNNFLYVDKTNGKIDAMFQQMGRKPSDETQVHLAIFRSTSANCVLHSHFLESLLFADLFPKQKMIYVEGLELLKGFKGINTHLTRVPIPCYANTQDMQTLSEEIEKTLRSTPYIYGILLRGHGLYVWGESVQGAKRHLEVFSYVFKYFLRSHGKFS